MYINKFPDMQAAETKNCFFMVSKFTDDPQLIGKAAGAWYNDLCTTAKSFVCYHDGGEPIRNEFP